MVNFQVIEEYYSDPEQVRMRIRHFLYGNLRVDRAWETLSAHVHQPPKHILEVGCSIGVICWRMGLTWPDAKLVGLDLTKEYVEIGNKLFGSPNLKFVHGTLPYSFSTRFDLIVLMDVYEHVSLDQRILFNNALKENLASNGVIFLSVPTPRFQKYIREHLPEEVQPIDEDITISTVGELAKILDKDVLLYQENSVYYTGDYTHVILGDHGVVQRVSVEEMEDRRAKLRNLFRRVKKPVWADIVQRKALVKEYFPDFVRNVRR